MAKTPQAVYDLTVSTLAPAIKIAIQEATEFQRIIAEDRKGDLALLRLRGLCGHWDGFDSKVHRSQCRMLPA
jgi:Zn-dependent oligopeptidase